MPRKPPTAQPEPVVVDAVPPRPVRRRRVKGQRLTRDERALAKVQFLELYRQTGNLTAASDIVGVDHNTPSLWRKADPEFARAYLAAGAAYDLALENEAARRGKDGVKKPLVSNGRAVKDDDGRVMEFTEYSDNLLMFLMKRRMPEYRDNPRITVQGQVAHEHTVSFVDDPAGAELARRLVAHLGAAAGGRLALPGGPGVDREQ